MWSVVSGLSGENFPQLLFPLVSDGGEKGLMAGREGCQDKKVS